MRISKNNLDMLWRVALAEHFTSPTTPARYDAHAAFEWLQRNGLVKFEGRGTLTLAGREMLVQQLDADKLDEWRRMEARRADRLRKPPRWPGSIG